MSKLTSASGAALAVRLGLATVAALSFPACGDAGLDDPDDTLDVSEQQSGRGNQNDGRGGNGGRGNQNDGRGNDGRGNDGRGNDGRGNDGRGNDGRGGNGGQQQQTPPTTQPTRPVGAPVASGSAEGGFFVAVNANGTGCPAGSWVASISPDGQVFTMTFSAYEIRVNTGVQSATRNCVLGLKLQSPRGLQFSLPTLYYSGYAFLEQNVSARQTANYTFRGGAAVNQPPGQLRGPYDSDFVFTHEARTVQSRTWSPCGYDRVVNVNTQIDMQNGNPRASGYLNLNAVDGSQAKVVLRLAWRGCAASGPAPNYVTPSAAASARSAAPSTATINGETWSTPSIADS